MAEINKPDYTYLWSSGGSIVTPSSVKIQTGWTAEVPPFQWENWSQNRQDQAIAHILQHGISVWDAATEYQVGKSYVTGSNGKIYVALQTNANQNPVTDTLQVYWADILKENISVFSTTGLTVWTVPTILKLGVKTAYVTVIGAGGGGGTSAASNAGSGGGAGGLAEGLVDLTGSSTVNITVGAGGAAGISGGTSSFGAVISCTGGGGATGGAFPILGAGGIASGTSVFRINTLGSGFQRELLTGSRIVSGRGGGAGGGDQTEVGAEVTTGNNATIKGCGGSGGTNGGAGGSGANGLVIVRW